MQKRSGHDGAGTLSAVQATTVLKGVRRLLDVAQRPDGALYDGLRRMHEIAGGDVERALVQFTAAVLTETAPPKPSRARAATDDEIAALATRIAREITGAALNEPSSPEWARLLERGLMTGGGFADLVTRAAARYPTPVAQTTLNIPEESHRLLEAYARREERTLKEATAELIRLSYELGQRPDIVPPPGDEKTVAMRLVLPVYYMGRLRDEAKEHRLSLYVLANARLRAALYLEMGL